MAASRSITRDGIAEWGPRSTRLLKNSMLPLIYRKCPQAQDFFEIVVRDGWYGGKGGGGACSLPTKVFTNFGWRGETVSARRTQFSMTLYDAVFSSVPGKIAGQERVEFLHLAKI